MSQIHPCKDNSDITPLYPSRGLYLKPVARLNVTVHYPQLKQSLTTGGKSVSSWDIMERIKGLVSPETFVYLRVLKNTLEFIRFEGDLENRDVLKKVLTRLDGKSLKVTGFKEPLKILAAEGKLAFPSKYDWDTYFRDAKNMNEMKAGERPDTVHFQNLPCKWFCEGREDSLPSEKLFKRIFSTYGDVRAVDIPVCDPYRSQLSSGVRGISTFTFSNDSMFEAYVQYKDYMSFVKAMDALRGCCLFHQEGPMGKYFVANIKVDFDKSKHLSDDSIKKRKVERDRLMEKDKVKKTASKLSKMEAEVRDKKQQEKEKKETEKSLAKIEYKIAMEERKYLIARRKLEAIRLMDYLFETVKKNIVGTAERNRALKEKTKEEMKKLEKAVIEKNVKEKQLIESVMKRRESDEHDKPKKSSRRLKSSVVVAGAVSKQDKYSDVDSSSDEPKEKRSRSRSREPDEGCRNEEQPHSGRYHYSNRYLGDWELKGKSNGGSEINISSNFVPFRGRGGGSFRGRGHHNYPFDRREFYEPNFHHPPPPHHHYRGRGDFHHPVYAGRGYHRINPHQSDRIIPNDEAGQTVRHDFSYLDELDRAYEKYFTSITKRHEEQ